MQEEGAGGWGACGEAVRMRFFLGSQSKAGADAAPRAKAASAQE